MYQVRLYRKRGLCSGSEYFGGRACRFSLWRDGAVRPLCEAGTSQGCSVKLSSGILVLQAGRISIAIVMCTILSSLKDADSRKDISVHITV